MFAFICITVALPLGFLGPLIFSETISQASGLVFFFIVAADPLLINSCLLNIQNKEILVFNQNRKNKIDKKFDFSLSSAFYSHAMLCYK